MLKHAARERLAEELEAAKVAESAQQAAADRPSAVLDDDEAGSNLQDPLTHALVAHMLQASVC